MITEIISGHEVGDLTDHRHPHLESGDHSDRRQAAEGGSEQELVARGCNHDAAKKAFRWL